MPGVRQCRVFLGVILYMPLTPEELKEAHRKGGKVRWKDLDSTERSKIMSAVRKGVKKGSAESYQQVVNKGI